jgi:transcription antitermination factor NusG
MIKNWYAVYTKPKCERRFCNTLTRKKIEHFFPTFKVDRKENGESIKETLEPLFPSMVFVLIENEQMNLIRQQHEVINFMYWLGRPISIRGIEIENIQEFIETNSNIVVEKTEVNSSKMNRIISRKPIVRSDENVLMMRQTEIRLTLPTLGFTLFAITDQEVFKLEQDSEKELPSLMVS